MPRRRLIAALLTLAILPIAAARAQNDPIEPPRAVPPFLQGGVQQDQTPDFSQAQAQLAQDTQWEAEARSFQQSQEEAQAGGFMGNPLVFRVTSVGDILKQDGVQKITALAIHTVTISADGSVDLGQIVDGSGNVLYIPPGSLQKGDLFTQVGNQYVKVPADHFDAMGSLADQVNKQPPADSPSALNNVANQLANAADAYKNNAASFANDFLLAAGNVMGNTIQFLAQPRSTAATPLGPGQASVPLQQLWNYLNNDYNQNDQALHAAAQQALQTLATKPGAVAGNLFMAALPAGPLGKEAEVAQATQATQRLAAVENAATEFANVERGLPPSQLENMNLQQATQKIFPNGNPPPPAIQPSPAAVRQFPQEWGGPAAVAPRTVQPLPATGGDTAVLPPVGGDTVITPAPNTGTVRTPTIPPNSPLQSRNIPTTPTPPRPPQKAVPMTPQQRQSLQNNLSRTPQKAIPMTPAQRQSLQNNLQKLTPALTQDAKWAGTTAPALPPSQSKDIINTLASAYGNTPKDPLQGAPGLLTSRFGIPTFATVPSITNALNQAGPKAQGLVFSQNPDNSLQVLNARNNNGEIEYLDPITEKRAQPPADSPLYFYRTH